MFAANAVLTEASYIVIALKMEEFAEFRLNVNETVNQRYKISSSKFSQKLCASVNHSKRPLIALLV